MEIVKLVYGGLFVLVLLDVFIFIMFVVRGGLLFELCEGDFGILMVILWSGFLEDIILDFLSLILVIIFIVDEGIRVCFYLCIYVFLLKLL